MSNRLAGLLRPRVLHVGLGLLTLLAIPPGTPWTLTRTQDPRNVVVPSSTGTEYVRLSVGEALATHGLAQITATPADTVLSYPPAEIPLQFSATPSRAAYPVEQATVTPQAREPYPVGERPTTAAPTLDEPQSLRQQPANLPAVVSDPEAVRQPTSADQLEQEQDSNVIFLWVGFVAALVIFASGVYGSIILFARKGS